MFSGFDVVMDTTLGREISLLETAKEFVDRFKLKRPHLLKKYNVCCGSNVGKVINGVSCCGNGNNNIDNSKCCNNSDKEKPQQKPTQNSISKPLPFLTSNCPGWICYAEKTQTTKLLQHISTIKSPQQIIANLLKTFLATNFNISARDIYHVSVAPCYDKKLEATRGDFMVDGGDGEVVREVDCVLSTCKWGG